MNIYTQSDFDISELTFGDALAGLIAVEDAEAFEYDVMSGESPIDGGERLLDPAETLALGIWDILGRKACGRRLYKGVALGLACLGGALTGLPFARLLPFSPGAQGDPMGGGEEGGLGCIRIDGLKADCDAYAETMISGNRLFQSVWVLHAARADFLPEDADKTYLAREAAWQARLALAELWESQGEWYRDLSVARAIERRAVGTHIQEVEAGLYAANYRYGRAIAAAESADLRWKERLDAESEREVDLANARVNAAREARQSAQWRLEDDAASARAAEAERLIAAE